MVIPEEVDEIDEYLHRRKQRQQQGEIPKESYVPPFVKKFGDALFGKKELPKPVLRSVQPTYASPQAQAAVKKQLEQIVHIEKPVQPAPRQAVIPIPYQQRMAAEKAANPPQRPPIVRPPVYQSVIAARAAAATPAPSNSAKNTQVASQFNQFQSFFGKKNDRMNPSRDVQSTSSNATSSPARTPVRYDDLAPVSTSTPGVPARKFTDIPPIATPSRENPLPSEKNNSSPRTDAPPWVSRRPNANPTPAELVKMSDADAANVLPWLREKKIIPKNEKQKNSSANFSSASKKDSSAIVQPTTTQNQKSFSSTPSFSSGQPTVPVEVPAKPLLARDKPWVSGEIRLDDEEKKIRKRIEDENERERVREEQAAAESKNREGDAGASPNEPGGEIDASLHEEITEEEALERLPFDDVEGLSQSDLDYLEQKEREHAQRQADEDPDKIDPKSLKEKLQRQTIQMPTAFKDEAPRRPLPMSLEEATPSPDEKQEILRRLKKMMEEHAKE